MSVKWIKIFKNLPKIIQLKTARIQTQTASKVHILSHQAYTAHGFKSD